MLNVRLIITPQRVPVSMVSLETLKMIRSAVSLSNAKSMKIVLRKRSAIYTDVESPASLIILVA